MDLTKELTEAKQKRELEEMKRKGIEREEEARFQKMREEVEGFDNRKTAKKEEGKEK